MAHHTPDMPDTMTGGVDLTGSVDFTEGMPDTLAHLNNQPDVIQTYTGGHGSLAGSVHMETGADYADHESADIDHGLHAILTRYDGMNVRVRPASRFRTNRWFLAPGQSFIIADRDARRLRAVLYITANTALDTVYVGNDLASVSTTGVLVRLANTATYMMEVRHGDTISVASALGNNALGVVIAMAMEIQEN